MDKKDIGKNIRTVREEAKLSREQLAEMANMSPTYLGEVERGEKTLGTDLFANLVEALDISADYILRNEITAGRQYVYDEVTRKMEKLNPKQRKTVCDIIDAYINNVLEK